MPSRKEFFTWYMALSASPMSSWKFEASSGMEATPKLAVSLMLSSSFLRK